MGHACKGRRESLNAVVRHRKSYNVVLYDRWNFFWHFPQTHVGQVETVMIRCLRRCSIHRFSSVPCEPFFNEQSQELICSHRPMLSRACRSSDSRSAATAAAAAINAWSFGARCSCQTMRHRRAVWLSDSSHRRYRRRGGVRIHGMVVENSNFLAAATMMMRWPRNVGSRARSRPKGVSTIAMSVAVQLRRRRWRGDHVKAATLRPVLGALRSMMTMTLMLCGFGSTMYKHFVEISVSCLTDDE